MIYVDFSGIDFKEIVAASSENLRRSVDRELAKQMPKFERDFYELIRAQAVDWLMLSPDDLEKKFAWMLIDHEAFTVYASGRLEAMVDRINRHRLPQYEKEWTTHRKNKSKNPSKKAKRLPVPCKCKFCTVSDRASRVFSWSAFTRKNVNQIRSLAASFVHKVGLIVCPYCARNYIAPLVGVDTDIYRPDLDHFYAQSIYPYFGICLSNLIPSCSACNCRIKLDEDFMMKGNFHPYLHKVPERLFSVEGLSLIDSEIVRAADIKIKVDRSLSEPLARSAKFFHLEAAYEVHIEEVSDFLTSLRFYPDKVLEERARAIGVDPTAFKLSLRRSTESDGDYRKRPLGKLMRDLYHFAVVKT